MEVKKQFKWFSIFEYEKEQDYLREMQKAGWKFVKVTGLGMYHSTSPPGLSYICLLYTSQLCAEYRTATRSGTL